MRLLPTVLRAAGAQRPLVAALGLLMLVTSFLAAAAPPLLTGRYDHALRESITSRPELVFDGGLGGVRPPDAPATDAALQDINRAWPPLIPGRLLATTKPGSYDVLTPKLFITDEPRPLSALILSWDPGIASRVRYVSGRPPHNTPGGPSGGTSAGAPDGSVIEIALAARAAARLEAKAGDVLHLRGDQNTLHPPTVRISGLYEPVTATDPFWASRPQALAAPDVNLGRDLVARVSTAALDAPGYAALFRGTDVSLHYSWRIPVDAGRLTAAAAPRLSDDVSELRFTVQSRSPYELVTPLDTGLSTFTAQLRVTRAVLALALGGLGAVAIGVLALGSRLLLERMRPALTTMRARGGSLVQMCGLACGTVALVAVPAALGGYGLALLTGGPPALSWVLVVLAAALLVPAATIVTGHRGRARPGERQDLTAVRAAPRRLVLEGLVVAVAVVGTVVLRRRGLTTESAVLGTDPFVTAVPVLLALAAGLLLLRGYPYPLRAVGRLMRRGRSAVSFLGVALAARQRTVTVLPMVVLLLATAVTGFVAAINVSVSRAQVSSAWHQVGADARVTASVMDPAAVTRVKRVKGVEDAIPARIMDGAQLTSAGAPPETLSIIAVDLDAYRRIVADRPVRVPPGPRAGGGAAPALFSPTLAGRAAAKGMSVEWTGGRLPVRRAGTIDAFPTHAAGIGFVVIPYSALDRANAEPNTIFVRGDHLDAAQVRQAAVADTDVESDVFADTYTRVHDELTGAPLVGMIHDTFRLAALAVGGYGTLTILLALITGATARGRTVSYLRTLGLSRGQARRLAVVELGPVILCAAVAGWVVGVLLPYVVGPAVDLRAYTGGFPAADFTLDLTSTVLLVGGLAVSAGLALAIDTMLTGRRQLNSALRMGDEP